MLIKSNYLSESVFITLQTATLCLSEIFWLLCVRELLVVVLLLKNVGKLYCLFIYSFIAIFGLDV